MSEQTILVVDDEPDIRNLVQEILEDEGYVVSVAGSGASARKAIEELKPRMMLLDIWMPDEDGITLLKSLKSQGHLDFPVVMMSGHGTVETAVEATRHGAVDFIEKPLSLAKLLLTVEKALKVVVPDLNTKPKEDTIRETLGPLIGKSKYNLNLLKQVAEVAMESNNVCIFGPPATGKLLVANHIHASSLLADKPCIQLYCDSLSKTNSARELLGEGEYGSLNGGYIDAAAEGTLILNDVEYLPRAAQSILLDVLQKKALPQGGRVGRKYNIRTIATSGMKPEELIAQGKFLSELFNLLNGVTMHCLPLNERQEDIPLLLDYYVNWFVESESLPYRHFSVAAQNRLRNHEWPRNIVELKNLVQRLMILGKDVEIDLSEVDNVLGGKPGTSFRENSAKDQLSLDLPLREARAAFEKIYMLHQLQLVEGNIGELAKRVGMERTHLYRKLRGLGIDLERIRD